MILMIYSTCYLIILLKITLSKKIILIKVENAMNMLLKKEYYNMNF